METAGMGGAIPAQGMGGAIQPQHFQYVTHNNLKVKFLQFFFQTLSNTIYLWLSQKKTISM